jgi:hypothetical protein
MISKSQEVDIAVDFSKREGYLLQPQKSVVIPINTCKKSKMLEINDAPSPELLSMSSSEFIYTLKDQHLGLHLVSLLVLY